MPEALEHLEREYEIIATVGMSITDRRWAGGIPLIDEDGVRYAVFTPESGLVNDEAFVLLAGMLLVFTTVKDVKRFDRNTRNGSYIYRRVPVDGWKMQYTEVAPDAKAPSKAAEPRCRRAVGPCACTEPQLTASISGSTQLERVLRGDGPGRRPLQRHMSDLRWPVQQAVASYPALTWPVSASCASPRPGHAGRVSCRAGQRPGRLSATPRCSSRR
ncbi:hypothetical protein OG782_00195 [Streptomyces sp. NBC_00876]|uniref:hypothetical protein n=1 Tax=Streptomyces sp. NBC_00876 TaxID=2975853 RepID=UPI003868DFED|nr:hypothetical protein OG782_00195 [Streptomyces sp. NBC_00876]